jgi:hypothetical protein
MTPTKFPEQNCWFAKNQPPYLPLPAYAGPDGEVISCWKTTLRERIKFLFDGRLWLRQLTFGAPLQPQSPSFDTPFVPQPPTPDDLEARRRLDHIDHDTIGSEPGE